MKYFLLIIITIYSSKVSAQFKRLDTSMQLGKAGYRVYCSNKSADKNAVSIKLIGFESGTGRDLDFPIDGRIKNVAIEDFNNDGFPDMVMYVYSGADASKVNIIGIASVENKSCAPIVFPDIRDDLKLRVGYNGHDEFTIIEGALFRKFPLYDPTNLTGPPTEAKRTIQYKVVRGERGSFKFVVLRSYESK